MPLATPADRRALVLAAGAASASALANNRYSADAVAIAQVGETLAGLPDLPSDNALPRWLAEVAQVEVRDLGTRRRLAMDVDSPLDLVLLEGAPGFHGRHAADGAAWDEVRTRLAALRRVAADPAAELLIAGRTSATDLRWLERRTGARTRALVEERGLRTASAAALSGHPNRRPPRSVLGALLDRDGPGSLGHLVAALGDGALIDSRVLFAHRCGVDERAWPTPEDRFASDLLLVGRIHDPWLAELAAAARDAPIPILLGGHSLVGPGLRLALRVGTRGRRAMRTP